MEAKIEGSSKFFQEVELTNVLTLRCSHIMFFLCWLGLLLSGTTIVGYGASNFLLEQPHCPTSDDFCTYSLTLDADRSLYFYIKVYPVYQNNRLYLDAYSNQQLHGQNGTGYECGPSYSTYDQLGLQYTAGGYRVLTSSNAHPCGFPMKTIFDDSVYVVDSEGGTPSLNQDLTSNYSTTFDFIRLANYAVSQWVDVHSNNFVNWFTIGSTSTKYMLMGKLDMAVGEYQVIHKNSYPTFDEFNKTLIITETNSLGATNHLLGYLLFGYGIMVLLVHVAVCCKSTQ